MTFLFLMRYLSFPLLAPQNRKVVGQGSWRWHVMSTWLLPHDWDKNICLINSSKFWLKWYTKVGLTNLFELARYITSLPQFLLLEPCCASPFASCQSLCLVLWVSASPAVELTDVHHKGWYNVLVFLFHWTLDPKEAYFHHQLKVWNWLLWFLQKWHFGSPRILVAVGKLWTPVSRGCTGRRVARELDDWFSSTL